MIRNNPEHPTVIFLPYSCPWNMILWWRKCFFNCAFFLNERAYISPKGEALESDLKMGLCMREPASDAIWTFSRQSHLCTVLSGWTSGLNVVRMRHPWCEVNCRILILYPAVTSFIAGFLFFTRQRRHSFSQFCKNCTKVWFPEKVFCWFVMNHFGSFLNIVARYNVFKQQYWGISR